jgi:hypothetical protein
MILNNNSLVQLNLAGCNIQEEDALGLLRASRKIRQLDFSFNLLKNKSAEILI